MNKRVFYSFDDLHDRHLAQMVSNIDSLEGNRPPSKQVYEAFDRLGDEGVMHWINNQVVGRQCTVVLIGALTANRAWTYYEIVESWNRGMGVVGLHIHGLELENDDLPAKGANPINQIRFDPGGDRLTSVVKSYNPTNRDRTIMLEWIEKNMILAVAEAIRIRNQYKNAKVVYSP